MMLGVVVCVTNFVFLGILSSKLLTVLTVAVNKSVRAIYVGWEDVGLDVVRFKAVEWTQCWRRTACLTVE